MRHPTRYIEEIDTISKHHNIETLVADIQVPLSAKADAPAHADLFVGNDEAQEGQKPRPKARGPGGQRLLHMLPAREVRTCDTASSVRL